MTIQDVKKKKKKYTWTKLFSRREAFPELKLERSFSCGFSFRELGGEASRILPTTPNRPEDIPRVEQVLGALSSQPLQVQKSQGCASSASTPHFLPLDIVWVIIYLCTSHFTLIGDTFTPMFTAALFTIVRTWKQPKCPSTEEQIKKTIYIYTTEYCSALYREQKGAICRHEWT